jgi:hypothetical protein
MPRPYPERVFAAIKEAHAKFGKPTSETHEMITRWVMRRSNEIELVEDGKSAGAGDQAFRSLAEIESAGRS